MAEQAVVLFAVTNGLLDEVPLERVASFEAGLLEQLRAEQAALLERIAVTGELTAEDEPALASAIEAFAWTFMSTLNGHGQAEPVPAESVDSTEAERAVM
jgi:F-type H+-transporting ATPase subunit alpha